jgi:hypothetical protein
METREECSMRAGGSSSFLVPGPRRKKHAVGLTYRRAVEVAIEPKEGNEGSTVLRHPVTAKEMMSVLNLMSSSPVALFLKQCSLQQKMMLAAVVRCVRREGIPEIPWRAVSALVHHTCS